jgi:PAS domain S-box-containing protein
MLNEVTKPGNLSADPLAGASGGSLLVVDDDAAFLEPLCEFLSEIGYGVRGCTSAGEALEALKEHNFDLLLTDLVMPEMDGIMLVRSALEIDPHLVGIIITGQATIQTAVEAMKVGAFDYLVKPLDFKILLPLLSRALGVRRLRIENVQLRDAVEIYKLRQTLQESERRLHELMANVKLITVMLDAEGSILFCNDFLLELSGWRREEVIGRNWFDIFIPDELQDQIREIFNMGIKTDSLPVHQENQIRTRNGETRVILWNNTVLRDLEGNVAGSASIGEDITERKRAEETAQSYQKALRSLVSALPLIEERERRRIAADLHDSIGQTLALSKMKLGALSESLSGDSHADTLNEIRELIEQSILYTRSLTSELSPPLLYELGFEAAVESLAEDIQKKHGIRIDVQDDGQPKPLDDGVSIVLYKAVRELLINVVKHAKAQRTYISIRKEGDLIRIILRDDGVGFRVSGSEQHARGSEFGFGLFNIRERLESINGCLEIDSMPGHGTRVAIAAPLKRTSRERAP